ncbi:MAG: phage holin family protein [Propionibacteriales bacterium]|nr:phage holin family protein [Propionibacteriales bacterium]
MPTPTRRIELSEWTQRLPGPTKRSLRRQSIALLVVALIFVLLVLAGLVTMIIKPWPIEGVVGVVVLSIISGLLAWHGIRRLRALPPGPDDQPIQFAAPYAFEIDGGMLRFPGMFGRPSEERSLADTTVVETGASLRLSSPGHRMRRFPARSFTQPTPGGGCHPRHRQGVLTQPAARPRFQ